MATPSPDRVPAISGLLGLCAIVAICLSGASTSLPDASAASSADQRFSRIARASNANYFDLTGDTNFAGGRDIQYVIGVDVATGGRRWANIGVVFTDGGCVGAAETVYTFLDADQNPGTGGGGGNEYWVLYNPSSGVTMSRWSGSAWISVSPTVEVSCRTTSSGTSYNSFFFETAPMGVLGGFNFLVGVLQNTSLSDRAPSQAPGYWNYQLTAADTPPPPEVDPLPEPLSYRDAANLPDRVRFTGESIKHVRLGEKLYDTMKRLGAPRVVSVACWSKRDWPSVVESTGGGNANAIVGLFYRRQSRWIHVAPKGCADVQGLMLDRQPNGQRAYALGTILHERIHALDVSGRFSEAQTECYAVQLVYSFARELSFPRAKALRLEQLAVRKSRALAPREYWNPLFCRDGGRWDLDPNYPNLDHPPT